MIARFHYDDSRLTQLLHNEGSEGSHELLEHLETCGECQARLDTLSSGGLSWDEVNELMRKDDPNVAELVGRYDDQREEPESLATSATFLRPSDYPDSLGRFSRYEVMEFLGRGGMGIVMRAYDTALQRNCAVKVLAPELASSAPARKRFSREARSAAAVVHPHVVPIQTVDDHNGLPYLVMPVVNGRSLQQRVEADGPLSVVETVRIAAQVAEGLAAAHAQGLVHRDIKPANILLENSVERVQLTDFGLARAIDDASMTRSGVIAGTPQYMSPEQAHGDPIDHRSDLFSLGSVMYFTLTGRSPFRAETTMGVLNRIGNDQPRSLRSINAEVPEWLEAIVMKLLSKSRDERFATAEEVAALLSGCLAHLQEPTTTPLPANAPSFIDKPQASVRSQFRESLNHSRLQLAVQRMGQPPIRWLVASAAFAFFAIAGTIIYLETSKGTLRIESNGEANVPVIIRQGDRVVEHLTVSSEGVNHRLHAGQYTIEIEGNRSDVSIIGNQVQLKRGETWVANVRWETQQTNPSISHSGQLNNSIGGPAKHGGVDIRSQAQISPDLFLLKSNFLSIRGEGLHPDLHSIIKVDLSSDAGIDWLFNESPVRREPLPFPFNVDNVSGEVLTPFIDNSDRIISSTTRMLCADATETFWNRIRGQKVNVHVSQEDFDTVVAGNEVTKVVYMPDGNSDLLDTLVSSRVEPGIDVFEEANRRGQAVVSIHLKPHTHRPARPKSSTASPDRTDNTLKLSAKEVEVVSKLVPTEIRGTGSVTITQPAEGSKVSMDATTSVAQLPFNYKLVKPNIERLPAITLEKTVDVVVPLDATIHSNELMEANVGNYLLSLLAHGSLVRSVDGTISKATSIYARDCRLKSYRAELVNGKKVWSARLTIPLAYSEPASQKAEATGPSMQHYEQRASQEDIDRMLKDGIQFRLDNYLGKPPEPRSHPNVVDESSKVWHKDLGSPSESVDAKVERVAPAKEEIKSYPVQEAPPEQADLSTPQATLKCIDLCRINNPTRVPVDCYTDDALLEMSGVMLQQLGYMSVISRLYSPLDAQIRIQTGRENNAKDSGPIIPGALPSFHLQVDALLKEHSLPTPPAQCKKAFELLLKSTVASLDGNESRAIPDRQLYRLAAGVLKSTREFLPKASELSKQFRDSSSQADATTNKVVTLTHYDIVIQGDEAVATTIVDRNSSATPMRFKLRRVNERWLVREVFSDEVLTQINLSMPQMAGDTSVSMREDVSK